MLRMILLCGLIFSSPAYAGAWLMNKSAGKLIVKMSDYRHNYRNTLPAIQGTNMGGQVFDINTRTREYDALVEYGLHEKISVDVKAFHSARDVNDTQSNSGTLEFSIRTSLPVKLGLTPPFSARLLRKIFKKSEVRQERPTAVALKIVEDTGRNEVGYGFSFLNADKLTIDDWTLLQETEYSRVKFRDTVQRYLLYRTQIGFKEKYWAGIEYEYTKDKRSAFESARNFIFVSAPLPKIPVILKVGRGRTRVSESPIRDKFTRLEIEYRF